MIKMKFKTIILTLGIGALTVTASIGADEVVNNKQDVNKEQKSECTYSKQDCPKTKACPHTDETKCARVKKKGCCPSKSEK